MAKEFTQPQITTRAHAKPDTGYFLERVKPGEDVQLIYAFGNERTVLGTFTPFELLLLITPEEIEEWKNPLKGF